MYPALSDLRRLEWETIKTISEMSEFGTFYDLSAIAQGYRTLLSKDRGNININLPFVLDIRLRADVKKTLKKRRVDLGALVIGDQSGAIESASYSLIICKSEDPKTSAIVRKLHFDFEPGSRRNVGELKPSVHMQVCGKYSDYHIRAGYRDSALRHWHPGFEKPRIPSIPMSIGIMLNWLLLEFQTDRTAMAILRHPRWRKLVAQAEQVVLRPYFKAATDFLSSASNRGVPFVEHLLYEVSQN